MHHRRGLRRELKKAGQSTDTIDAICQALETDYQTASLADADLAMLDYAVTLTKQPQQVTAESVERLRAHGFDDTAIHDICCVTAYYGFVNRVADGLGVDLEDELAGS